MISNFQERIITILRGSPNGLTSNEIAERLGATGGNLSSRLSKLAAYGIIGKSRYNPGGNVYRALTYERRCGNGMAARGAGTAVAPDRHSGRCWQ